MPIEYRHDELLDKYVAGLIGKLPEMESLLECKVEVVCCFCDRTDKDGQPKAGNGPVVRLRKISPVYQCFVDAQFLMIVESFQWENADNDQEREQMIQQVLSNAQAEKKEVEDGSCVVKTTINDYTYKFNRSTFLRYGRAVCDCLDEKGALTRTIVEATRPKTAAEDTAGHEPGVDEQEQVARPRAREMAR